MCKVHDAKRKSKVDNDANGKCNFHNDANLSLMFILTPIVSVIFLQDSINKCNINHSTHTVLILAPFCALHCM